MAGIFGSVAAVASADRAVILTIDGVTRTVHTDGDRVADVLSSAGIVIGAHDVVLPDEHSAIPPSVAIAVKRGRLLHLDVDGRRSDSWVTALTVAEATSRLGYPSSAFFSPGLSSSLALPPTNLVIRLPKVVSVTHDGLTTRLASTAATVGDLLKTIRVTVGADDFLSVAAGSPLRMSLTIVIQRVLNGTVSEVVTVPFPSKIVDDPTMPTGKTTLIANGHPGQATVLYAVSSTDGEQTLKAVISSTVTVAPVAEVTARGSLVVPVATPIPGASGRPIPGASGRPIPGASGRPIPGAIGTPAAATTKPAPRLIPNPNLKVTPQPTAKSIPYPTSKSVPPPAVTPNPTVAPIQPPSSNPNWDALARCESSGNWSINTGNGYFGGLQFSLDTWLGWGGGAYAPSAEQATRAQQITVATLLYNARGRAPWPYCGTFL